jgi:hypothetical protein
MNQSASEGTFVVVLHSPTALRIPEGERWGLTGLPTCSAGTTEVHLRGYYTEEGFANHVPRGILAEVSGVAADFDEAIQTFARDADFFAPILSLSANCHVPRFRHHLAYETTSKAQRRHFRQWFAAEEAFPRLGRCAAFEPFRALVDLCLKHQESARIYRAMVQYQEALASWRAGEELRSVMHLWMAVEALTKVFLRRELERSNVDTSEICRKWGIEKKNLDGDVRKRLIFQDDKETYDSARRASDGVEHMFEDFPLLHRMSTGARDKTAKYVRGGLLDLLQPPSPAKELLLGAPFLQPQDLARFDGFTLSGRLEGASGSLAAAGHAHPFFLGSFSIQDFIVSGDTYDMRVKNNLTAVLGPGVKFHADSVGAAFPLSSLEISTKKAAP